MRWDCRLCRKGLRAQGREGGTDLDKKKKAAIVLLFIIGLGSLFYLGGIIGQAGDSYHRWLEGGGVAGESVMEPP